MLRFFGETHLLAAAAATALLGLPAAARGQDAPSAVRSHLGSQRYFVSMGVYSLRPSTTVRLDSHSGTLGTTIDFESDLGLDGAKVSAAGAFSVRFGARHRLELEYFELARNGFREVRRQIRFGERTYEAGLRLETFFDTDVLRLGYAYSFMRNEKSELGVQAGLHVTEIETGMRISTLLTAGQSEQSASATAPLPVIGLQGAHELSTRWTMRGRLQLFRLEAEDYSGALNHVMLAVEHATFPRVGIGFAVDYFEMDVDSTEATFRGAVKLEFSGPRLYAHAHF